MIVSFLKRNSVETLQCNVSKIMYVPEKTLHLNVSQIMHAPEKTLRCNVSTKGGFIYRLLFFISIVLIQIVQAAPAQIKLTVSQTGKANFRTIQEAINSLPDIADSSTENRIIFIKNGTYNEKIFISKHHISLIGESRNKTILTYDIARDAWRCNHSDDWGVATLNLSGSDIELQNLTIINGYGYHHKENIMVDCKTDSTGKKNISAYGHQMALRSFATTKLKVINCNLKSFSGDTVSPWNTDAGMFYFKDCYMEGGVDFYCPRGWAYAENCTFFANHSDAAIWHDGSAHQDSKTVLVNCKFDGYDGFKLGRYHKDAQFYLINCTFSKKMANKPIYRVPTTNVIQWGERIYYYNSHRTGGDYTWFTDNLSTAENAPVADSITPNWVFGKRWNPIKIMKMTETSFWMRPVRKIMVADTFSLAKHNKKHDYPNK